MAQVCDKFCDDCFCCGRINGCNDPTAYAATRPTAEEIEVSKLVKAIRAVAELFGYEIINRVEFRNRTTGKTYR